MLRQLTALLALVALSLLPGSAPLRAAAQNQAEHLVPQQELHQRLEKAEAQRLRDQSDLERLFAGEEAQQTLRGAGLDPLEVTGAIPQLDDETLADLAQQSREIESDVSGGFFGGILIILVLIVALAVLLAVYVID